jgi:hypothetical protein
MMEPRIYVYKITFEDMPFWYWGVHKENVYGEVYMGSPKTNKWYWGTYTPIKQILECFPYTEEGWKEANAVEDRLIMPDLNNPFCLNERYGGGSSLVVCKNAGQKAAELQRGVHDRTYQQSKERKETSRKAGAKTAELGIGCHAPEYRGKGVANTNNQVWESTIDGFRGRACVVANHNKANGWDKNARVKVG